jgi:hypothetical protein
LLQGGAPFIAARGGWQWRRELRPGVMAALKQWARQSVGGYGPKAVGVGGHCCSDRAADEWAQTVSDFSNLSKTGLNLIIKMDALPCSKNS